MYRQIVSDLALFVIITVLMVNVSRQSISPNITNNITRLSLKRGNNPTVGELTQKLISKFDTSTKESNEKDSRLNSNHRKIDSTQVVSYKRILYATLDGWDPKDTLTKGCQSDYLPLPSGWIIAPNDADSIAVIAMYAWGTDLLVLSDGSQYYTMNLRYPGHAGQPRKWICCADGLTALGTSTIDGLDVYKVNSCSRRILIVKIVVSC
jgi:hypothetical protein